MVFVRDGCTEQREDAVPRRLRDVTAVAMHRLHHKLQHRIDDRARLFGIEIAHQFGRALDVGEQRGDGLALAIRCRRSIQLFRLHPNFRRRGLYRVRWHDMNRSSVRKRRTAIAAEFLTDRILGTAFRTTTAKRRAAVTAKLFTVRIFRAALSATHKSLLDKRKPGSPCITRPRQGVQQVSRAHASRL
jgi:hypothetical protein